MDVTSDAFLPNTPIPTRYTCEGEDVSPPLKVDNVPRDAKSLVLIVEDPDAPGGTWLHWLVWNIPVLEQIAENKVPGDQGMNDFGKITYGGPCPPSGTHRYFFKVFALDDSLNVPEGAGKMVVMEGMQNHILAYGELIGSYEKSGHGQGR